MDANDNKNTTLTNVKEVIDTSTPPPKTRSFQPTSLNLKMNALKDIFPNKTRKQLRRILKNKAFMARLDVRDKPKV